MRAVIQRVNRASVSIDGVVKSEIGNGLLVLLGIENEDNNEDIEFLSLVPVKKKLYIQTLFLNKHLVYINVFRISRKH